MRRGGNRQEEGKRKHRERRIIPGIHGLISSGCSPGSWQPFLNLGGFSPEHQLVQVWARIKPVTLEGASMVSGWLPYTTCEAGGTGRPVFSHTSWWPKTAASARDACKQVLHLLLWSSPLFFRPFHRKSRDEGDQKCVSSSTFNSASMKNHTELYQ